MAIDTHEPRALTAALSQPVFATRGAGLAMHVADRHVERWAPESGANRVRPLRNLGFVDRLVSPWIETAQRSASLRLFSQYHREGMSERAGADVSWVFPRPWYQDELAWMAAARQAPRMQSPDGEARPVLTTRGTYVPPASVSSIRSSAQAVAMPREATTLPAALYEYVAPSLSIAAPTAVAGVGYGGESLSAAAWSPLVSLAAVQAAEVMSRAVTPTLAAGGASARMSPALRNVLSTMLERASVAPRQETPMTRLAGDAPELVTPPAPRPEWNASRETVGGVSTSGMSASQAQAAHAQAEQAMQLAQQYAEQRAKIVEVQRVAQKAAERELAARIEAQRTERAPSTPSAPAATTEAETRAIAARTEELRQRTAAARGEAVAQSQAAAQAQANEAQKKQIEEATAERARIEERIAQRVAERQRGETRARTLHEQARIEAATHARELQSLPTTAPVATAPTAPAIPADVAAAFAALPPELAAYIGQRPDQAMRAIDELSEAMRTVELMARTTASGGSFASSRGPRLMMPAGIGGLVSAVDRAHAIAPTTQFAAQPALAPLQMATAARSSTLASSARVPNLAFLRPETLAPTRTEAGSARIAATAPTSTFAAVSGSAPAALEHVAWADRWLARFAGASAQSLDTFSAAGGRMQSLVEAAPSGVFVAPMFDSERDGERVRVDTTGRVVVSSPISGGMSMPALAAAMTSTASARAPEMTSFVAPGPMRFDDNAETPDDVFAAISAAASRNRAIASAPTTTTAPAAAATPSAPFDRTTAADLVAHAAPSAPGAGFAAQLASSPFASALRHVLPMASAATFDVRALFGGNVSATYLAGLLAAGSEEVELAVPTMPSWATWADSAFPTSATVLEREAPSFDAAYVAGEEPAQRDAIAASAGEVAPTATTTAPVATTTAPLATLRTALLSWSAEVPTFDASATAVSGISPTILTSAESQPITTSAARAMIDAMSLPLLDDTFHPLSAASAVESPAFAAPGMIGSRAQAWSVAQERSSSDLALDFVSPELVLAARVYGLGPAEAAQAARLAIAGPGPLGAMASTVDRTFVQAMAIESDRRIATMYPTTERVTPAITGAPTSAPAAGETPMAEAMRTMSTQSSGMAFGVDRRAPRGAFLWPSATVAALGLNAAGPDGEQSMSVAALELLAAQAVAELGTFAALSPASDRGAVADDEVVTSAADVRGGTVSTLPIAGGATSPAARVAEPSEQDVLDAAVSMVPSARRARFEALYVALGQTGAVSPAARAARALALAGRGEETLTARERASLAWDVLPVVYAADGRALDADAEDANSAAFAGSRMPVVASRGVAPARAGRGENTYVDADLRPGLGSLSSRAGEALGSYVAPSTGESRESASSSVSSSSGAREVGAVLRAPTAAQELVRTGRPSGRFGGGEVEIPTWFEAAARKMLEERSGASDGISLAELTLVTAAPTTQVAASSRAVPTAAPLAPGATTSKDGAAKGEPIDVEKIANEIYRHILTMMDAARERNGEPYL